MLDKIGDQAKVFIYGTGDAGISLLAWILKTRPDLEILGFIDTFSSGKLKKKKVYSLESFLENFNSEDFDKILIASAHSDQISERLRDNQVDNYLVMKIPVYLLGQIYRDTFGTLLKRFFIKVNSLIGKGSKHYFFGEYLGHFSGNNKYFYLHLREKGLKPVWVTDKQDVKSELESLGVEVLLLNRFIDFLKLKDGYFFYFDTMNWQRKYPFLRFFNSKKIHMSHGVGLKMTLMMLLPDHFRKTLTNRELKRIEERIFYNHLLVSTSQFYANEVSVPAYNTPADRISCAGYPRNDVFYRKIEGEGLFVDESLVKFALHKKSEGWKLAIYTPTFRDNSLTRSGTSPFDYQRFSVFLRENRILFVIKPHPHSGDLEIAEQDVCLKYDNSRDIYPLLREADLLITDYSSIYTDFLHTGKPLVFYPYDYENYLKEHHDIQFDYEEMTPGPKASNYEDLEKWMNHFLLKGEDGFEEKRNKILKLAFNFQDGNASERLFKEMASRWPEKLLNM